tara:strand:+ start:1439 stop:1672 length:234 start_codon:yes stop_codon:yes gene_type:complete
MAEETERKQGKPWTNKAVFRTYEEAFALALEINEMSALSEKKVRAKIKRRSTGAFVVKVRAVEPEPVKHKKSKAKKK